MTQDLIWIALVVLAVVVFLWLRSRRHAATRPGPRPERFPGAPVEPSGSPQPAAWSLPRYEAARQAVTGPALSVSINMISARDHGLMVSWSAHNVGSLPVAVQWGAPEVLLETEDSLQLRYLYDRQQPFVEPEARVCQPDEILSRSVTLPGEAVGREFGGLRVTVAVGYGSADERAVACTDQERYLDWQRVAVSPPRIAPRG